MNKPASLSNKLIKNTLFNTVGRVWGVLVNLILTPYIISQIGVERFGIWAIIGILTGYLGLLDLGIGGSFVKFIAQYQAKNDQGKLSQLISTAFFFCLGLGIVTVILGYVFIDPLLKFFSITPQLYQEARFVFLAGIILFALTDTFSVFTDLPNGLQRMEVANLIKMLITIPKVGGTVFCLAAGYGLPGLIMNSYLVWLSQLVLTVIAVNKLLPGWSLSPALFKSGMLKELFNFGINFQLTYVSYIVNAYVDKILISHYLGLALLTYYQLGATISLRFQEFSFLLTSAFVPAAAELFAQGDRERLIKLYHRGVKYVAMFSLPAAVLIVGFAPSIMSAWMGPGYSESVRVIQILTPAFLINLFACSGVTLAWGMGKPGLVSKAALIHIILNLTLNLVLISKFGFIGAAWGTAISFIIITGIFLNDFHRYIQIPLISYFKLVIQPLIFSLAAGLPLYLANRYLSLFNTTADRLVNLLILAANSIIFLGIYAVLLLRSDYLDNYDREIVRKLQLKLRLVKPSSPDYS